jgi:hypothetical protein
MSVTDFVRRKSTEKPNVNFKRVYIEAVGLIVLDAYVFQFPLISFFVILLAIFVSLPINIRRYKKDPEARPLVKKYLIYVAAVVLAFTAMSVNNLLAEYRARELIQKIELYKSENGAYPKSLKDLMPRYLGSIPRAKWVPFLGEYYYFWDEDRPVFGFVVVPPFGRRVYSFAGHRWGSIG